MADILQPILKTKHGASYCAEALDAMRYLRDDGQRFAMAWVDGPYFMGKGEWDPTLSLDAAVAWYAPYLEALTAVCAPSASVYLWGTDELEAELRRPMRALGWTLRGRVTWDKVRCYSQVGYKYLTSFPDPTEACGFYQRGEPTFNTGVAFSTIWRLAPDSWRDEKLWDGVHQLVKHQPERNAPAHPCQKPIAFAERAVLASTRPGEAVLDLFAGTHRIAVAVERMKEARSWVAVEQDPRWAAIVRPHLQWDAAALAVGAQPSLFGGGDARKPL